MYLCIYIYICLSIYIYIYLSLSTYLYIYIYKSAVYVYIYMYNGFLCIKAEEAEVCRNFDCEVLFAALTSVMATAKLLVTSMLLRRHGLCIPDVALGFQIDQLLTSYG